MLPLSPGAGPIWVGCGAQVLDPSGHGNADAEEMALSEAKEAATMGATATNAIPPLRRPLANRCGSASVRCV